MERTLLLVKPDGVQRGLIGEVISRVERRGLSIVAMKMLRMDEELAKRHYAAHTGKPFFEGLISYITSGPIVAMVIEGERAIETVRSLMGATDPAAARPGTIRADFALDIQRNIVHGSDGEETAEREIALFFDESEIYDYQRALDSWVYS